MGSKRILLVEDAATMRMVESMTLRGAGYEVLTASNGEEGVAKAIAEQPDLILMDVIMPKMNGLDACKKIRESENMKSIPIIMLTTRSEEDQVEIAFTYGCNDYITKPFDTLELLEKIKSHLDE